MKRASLLAVLCLVAVATGCSSTPSIRDRYENLDYDSKSVFLVYYPYLTPDQRNEFLSDPMADPRKLIESWQGEFNDPGHEVGSFEEMMSQPSKRKIKDLQIETGLAEPVTSGTSVPLRAYAVYATGKRVEVTPDVDWRVGSSLAKIDRSDSEASLHFDCVDSDLTVGADFLGERDSSRTIRIRKPLERLDIKVSEAYIGIDSGYNFKLVLLARCKDGTISNVSCQASWQSASDAGKVGGCGNFVISSKQKLAEEEALTVTARYGNLSLRKTLHPPVR